MPEARRPLEREDVHRHGPAAVHLTEDAVGGHDDVVEEHLGELGGAVQQLERAHRDPRRVDVDEERSDSPVRGSRRAGAGEEDARGRVLRQAGPQLLPVDHPVIVDPGRPARQRGEVTPGARLGEALAPHGVAAEELGDLLAGELGRRELRERRGQDLGHRVEARFHESPGRDLLAEQRGAGSTGRRGRPPTPAIPTASIPRRTARASPGRAAPSARRACRRRRTAGRARPDARRATPPARCGTPRSPRGACPPGPNGW